MDEQRIVNMPNWAISACIIIPIVMIMMLSLDVLATVLVLHYLLTP